MIMILYLYSPAILDVETDKEGEVGSAPPPFKFFNCFQDGGHNQCTFKLLFKRMPALEAISLCNYAPKYIILYKICHFVACLNHCVVSCLVHESINYMPLIVTSLNCLSNKGLSSVCACTPHSLYFGLNVFAKQFSNTLYNILKLMLWHWIIKAGA